MTEVQYEADVVIIGSGIAGALAGYELARQGVKVLILEAGPRVSRAGIFDSFLKSDKFDPVSIYPNTALAPRPIPHIPDGYLINTGKFQYEPQYIRAVGGTTWHWTAGTSRLNRNDMSMKSTYGVGVDWPISHAVLEPYYSRAEQELGVSGSDDGEGGSKRSIPAPMKQLPLPYLHRRVSEILAPHGFEIRPVRVARNSREYDGRPPCAGNNNCLPICPIGAQYAAIVHVEKAEAAGARVIADAAVFRLDTGIGNAITAVHFKRPDNSLGIARGRYVVVAANGLETARLLLMSADTARPGGLANSSGLVGCNLMDHPGATTRVMVPFPVFTGRGPTNAGSIPKYVDGPFRRHRAAAGLSLDNKLKLHDIADALLRSGLRGKALDEAIRYRALRTFEIVSFVEMLPNENNRVSLALDSLDTAGLPRMSVRLDFDDYSLSAMKFMASIHGKLGKLLGALEVAPVKTTYVANHLMGTAVMGDNPRRSVVDKGCRSHDHPNLFVAGSAVFPTAGANKGPTLTIAALSIRIAESIRADMRGQ